MAERPRHEVAEVFQRYLEAQPSGPAGPAWSWEQRSVVDRILACRTARLGGHVDECDACGQRTISYNSCRNMIRWTHCLEEFRIRFGPYPSGLPTQAAFVDAVPRPSQRGALAGRLVEAFMPTEGIVVRYSSPAFVHEAFAHGRFRFAPASDYADASLNYAVKDDELLLDLEPEPGTYEVSMRDRDGNIMATRSGFQFRQRAPSDFLVLCMSQQLLPRLFTDFSADACLVVRDPQRLVTGLQEAVAAASLPFRVVAGPVQYVDPVRPAGLHFDLRLSKHFRYTYQREFRVVLEPKQPTPSLEPVFVEAGSMRDYSEMLGAEA